MLLFIVLKIHCIHIAQIAATIAHMNNWLNMNTNKFKLLAPNVFLKEILFFFINKSKITRNYTVHYSNKSRLYGRVSCALIALFELFVLIILLFIYHFHIRINSILLNIPNKCIYFLFRIFVRPYYHFKCIFILHTSFYLIRHVT